MKLTRTIVALGAAASMSIGMFAAPAVAQPERPDVTATVDADPGLLEGTATSNLVGEAFTAPDGATYTVVALAGVTVEEATDIFRVSYWVDDATGDVQTNRPEDETGWSEKTAWLLAVGDDQAVDVTAYVAGKVQPDAGVVSLEVVTEAGFETPGDESTASGVWVTIYEADEVVDRFFLPGATDGGNGGTNVAASAALLDITASSGDTTAECGAAVATVGVPLLLLPPLALSSQLGFAGLSEITAGVEAQLQNLNTQIQQGTGIFDPETARLIEQVNNALAAYGVNAGQVVGVAGLLLVGGLAANHILGNCL